jgi:hypothetical protein
MPARRERPQSAAADYAMTLEETVAFLADRRFSVSVWTLKRRIEAGVVPAIRIGSRQWVMR